MADIAQKIPLMPAADRGLLHAGAAILGIAFLAKAAMWPLNFWLAPAYSAASAPVAALFVILTKVGVYAVLRLWTLLLSAEAGAPVAFGGDATDLRRPRDAGVRRDRHARVAAACAASPGFGIIISSGTLLAVIGFGARGDDRRRAVLPASVRRWRVSALVPAGRADRALTRGRSRGADRTTTRPTTCRPTSTSRNGSKARCRERAKATDEEALVGRAIPAATAFLGLSFIACALMIAGLAAAVRVPRQVRDADRACSIPPARRACDAALSMSGARWTLLVLLIGSSLLATIALSRAGIRHFWAPQDRPAPRLRTIECAPIAALLLVAGRADCSRGARARAIRRRRPPACLQPAAYIEAVMSATPVPTAPRRQSPRRRGA